MESFFEILINGGPMGLFAAYLVWQTKEQQKRMDGWIQQIAATEEKASINEGKLRDRYDAVIAKIEAEKLDIFRSLTTTTENVMVKLNELSADVKILSAKISQIEADISRIEQDIDLMKQKK